VAGGGDLGRSLQERDLVPILELLKRMISGMQRKCSRSVTRRVP
jgi:hypothetical protein